MNDISEYTASADAIIKTRFYYTDAAHPAVAEIIRLASEYIATALADGAEIIPPETPPEAPQDTPQKHMDPFDILQKEISLPSLPSVYAELQQVIADETSSASDVARVISSDTSLTAFLLRLVNSAFYSFPSQIDTISRAVAVVGTRQLSTLALGTSVMSMFTGIPEELINMEKFWKHSITVGVYARNLASCTNTREPERFFVAGLLHDIGRLAMCKVIPERLSEVLSHAGSHNMLIYNAERALLGFDHATLGGMLLRKWNLPFPLVNAVLHHHDPASAKNGKGAALIHMADILASAFHTGPSSQNYVPPLDADAWKTLDIAPADIPSCIANSDEQIRATLTALLSPAT